MDFLQPATWDDALVAKAERPDALPIFGGTDVMVDLNFDTYGIMRLAEMPKVETVIVPTYDFWGGVGEPTICVVSPAVLNAIFAATGKPMRTLPLRNPVEALAKA